MAPVAEELRQAVALHQAGRRAEASAAYWAILTRDPNHAETLHLLAVVKLQEQTPAEAIPLLERAIAANPKPARFHESLGEALAMVGRHQQAAASFAAAAARGANTPAFLANFGLTALKADQPALAEPALRALVALAPANIDGLINLASALSKLERKVEAEPYLRRALEVAPDNAAAHGNLAILLRDRNALDDATTHVDRALALNPDFVDALATKASILAMKNLLPEAAALYRRAIELEPTRAKTHSAYSVVLHEMRDLDGAMAANARSIALDPGAPEPHFNRAMYLFARGRMSEAWIEYDWRWRTPGVPARWRDFPQPLWKGGPVSAGKRILVWAEQGVGDEILYASMMPDLIARHRAVTFECDPRLVPLFARSFPDVTVVPRADPADPRTHDPTIAAQTPAADLGRVFRPDLASFPKREHFLVADQGATEEFRRRLAGKNVKKVVGMSWISRNATTEKHKSATLADWVPLLRATGCHFVDLQYGDTTTERASLPPDVALTHVDGLDLRNELDRLAALISACDVVITVCNVTAHLGAALGKPTWILTSHERGRLWWTFVDRTDSPWYPTVRFFRQTQEGDWREPIARAAEALVQRSAP